MIVVKKLIWDGWNRGHIQRHDVVPDEVEQVCQFPHHSSQTYSNRLRVIGATATGRVLTIILAMKAMGQYYTITARSASKKERSMYNKQIGGDQAA